VLPGKTSTPTGHPSALQSKAITILFVTPLAIAIIVEGDEVALGIGSFKVAAGNVVEHQMTILEMTSCQGALNSALALQEPIHRQITMEVHIDFGSFGAVLVLAVTFAGIADRQDVEAEGARRGASAAVQVADRFHLVLNLTQAVERELACCRSAAASNRLPERTSTGPYRRQRRKSKVKPSRSE
jgi:hypothetical protein